MTRERSTEELVRDARGGDRGAFDILVRGVEAELRSFALSRLGPALRERLEPEDVAQETLLRAFESIERFEWRGPESLKRWLFAIAEHIVRNVSRKRSLTTGSLSLDARSTEPSPSRAMRRGERLERLRESIRSLSPDYRTVIELARIEGLRIREISERMDRSEGAVKQLLSRALESLRARFGDTASLGLPDGARKPGERDDA